MTIANSDSVNQSLWTVALIKDDDTYVLNPAVGTYSGIVAIQVNGVAYNTSGSIPTYYMVVGADDQEYMDGMQSQSTNRYHLELT